jgi:hypothetical protein
MELLVFVAIHNGKLGTVKQLSHGETAVIWRRGRVSCSHNAVHRVLLGKRHSYFQNAPREGRLLISNKPWDSRCQISRLLTLLDPLSSEHFLSRIFIYTSVTQDAGSYTRQQYSVKEPGKRMKVLQAT